MNTLVSLISLQAAGLRDQEAVAAEKRRDRSTFDLASAIVNKMHKKLSSDARSLPDVLLFEPRRPI